MWFQSKNRKVTISNFDEFCSISPKLPCNHIRLHCYAVEITYRGKGHCFGSTLNVRNKDGLIEFKTNLPRKEIL